MTSLARNVVSVVALAMVTAFACADRLDGVVRTRAALDLGCPEDQVRVSDLRSADHVREYSVSGCGRDAYYQAACSMGACSAHRAGEVAESLAISEAPDVDDRDLQPAPAGTVSPTGAAGAAGVERANASPDAAVAAAVARSTVQGGSTTMVADTPEEEPTVTMSETVTSSRVEAPVGPPPKPAPTLGPPQTVTLRNECPRTVTLFVGEKPGETGGRYMTLGSTNMIGPTLRSGEQVWLLDSKQAALTSVSVATSTREITIAESCNGLAAR